MTFNTNRLSSRHKSRALYVVTIALFLSTLSHSCKERNVPYIIHEDQIALLLADPYEGGSLFRSDHIINPDLYRIPGDTAQYRDSVIEHQRHYTILLSANNADYGHFGMLREAIARVNDSFAFQRTRSGVVLDTSEVKLVRYGFLLRFGDDADPYLGWKLWGFNGLGVTNPSAKLRMADSKGLSLQVDQSFYNTSPESLQVFAGVKFVLLSEIRRVALGSKVSLEVQSSRPDESPYYYLYSAETDAGFRTENLIKLPELNHFVDTLQISSALPNNMNLIYVQSHLGDGSRRVLGGWFIPYQKPLITTRERLSGFR